MFKFYLITVLLLGSCTGIPKDLKAVDGFEINRYLGTWYEIARLDHRFERGLENISATYTARDDGGIDVHNKGWNEQKKQWKQIEGKAYLIEQPDLGRLKVSFFGPLYSGYNIIGLDKTDYSYSVVTGYNKSYFWILSRTKQMPKQLLDKLVQDAKKQGFATEKLIYVKQD